MAADRGAADGDATGGGLRPTSGGTGGGLSLPSRAGREIMPAIAAAAMAAARPTLCHLICSRAMPS
jgi:hypothetical protein